VKENETSSLGNPHVIYAEDMNTLVLLQPVYVCIIQYNTDCFHGIIQAEHITDIN